MLRERITLSRRERSGMVPQAVSSSPSTCTGTGSRPPGQCLSAYRTSLIKVKDKNSEDKKSKVLSYLHDLEVPAIFGVDNAVLNLLDGQIARDRVHVVKRGVELSLAQKAG